MNKKTVWLTGGGTGIGKDLTKLLCDNGFDVIISGWRIDNLIEVAKYNKKKIFPYKLEVSNLKETDIVAKKIIKKFKFIDLLVLNAAIYSPGSLKEISPINAKKVIDINLTSTFLLSKSVIKKMLKSKKGKIINITSIVGHTGNIGQSNYAASKSGTIGMSKSLSIEYAKKNITINCVSPGFIVSDMTNSIPEKIKNIL